ncbi:hypothetical protein ACIG87_16365 [Micromonospora sp. NPDC051925]|uniref:hypothetical protein n=1 Tax=Micromonospora sp. NPDC051925 TaxID=3364288 RepID=UPI0037C9261A
MTRIVPRRLSAGLAAGLLAATLITPGVATAAPKPSSVPACLMQPLPLPAGVSLTGSPLYVDPTGRFIVNHAVRTTDQGRESLLLRWEGPRVTVLLTNPPGALVAVNRQGVLIGDNYNSTGNRPWRYRDGRLDSLPVAPNGISAYVTGINSRGDIVGFGGYLEEPVPLLWPVDRPGTVEVIEPGGIPVAILDDGTVVGAAPAGEDRSSHVAGVRRAGGREDVPPPVAWVRRPDGRIDRLTAPGAVKSSVWAARGNWAVGEVADTANGQYDRMVRWDLRTGVATPVKPGLLGVAGVNSGGSLIAGSVVDHLDHRVPLRSVASDPVTGTVADAIADNGTVVGRATGLQLSLPMRWSGC